MARVLIADDHALFRQGLCSLLKTIDYLEVIGEAEDGQSAVKLAVSMQPDLILMDIAMPGGNGLEAAREIKARLPGTKILIISMHTDRSMVRQALQAGAEGYIFKGAPFPELKLALECVLNNSPFLSPVLLGPVLNDYIKMTPGDEVHTRFKKLTPREKEIFELIVRGMGRQEIADRLFISPKTVDRHKGNLKEKLSVTSDFQLQDVARLLNNTG